MFKKIFIFIFLFLAFVSFGCSSKQPCTGGGKLVNNNPLPQNWAKLMTIPDGGVMCRFEETDEGPYHRYVEFLGIDPHAAMKKWQKHLMVTGWKENNLELNPTNYKLFMEKDHALLEVFVSKSVKKNGWTSVTFKKKAL